MKFFQKLQLATLLILGFVAFPATDAFPYSQEELGKTQAMINHLLEFLPRNGTTLDSSLIRAIAKQRRAVDQALYSYLASDRITPATRMLAQAEVPAVTIGGVQYPAGLIDQGAPALSRGTWDGRQMRLDFRRLKPATTDEDIAYQLAMLRIAIDLEMRERAMDVAFTQSQAEVEAKARFLATKVTERRPAHRGPEAFLKSLEQALAASLDSIENAQDVSLATVRVELALSNAIEQIQKSKFEYFDLGAVYLKHVEPTRVGEWDYSDTDIAAALIHKTENLVNEAAGPQVKLIAQPWDGNVDPEKSRWMIRFTFADWAGIEHRLNQALRHVEELRDATPGSGT